MKKLYIIMAAVLLLSFFQPCSAAENSTYSQESPSGYIVKLKQLQGGSVALLKNTELRELSSDAGLYYADSLSDVSELGGCVEYYEPDYTATLSTLPNDTYASEQWSISNLGISDAWDEGFNGKGVKIAVIDSGINLTHEDFTGTHFAEGYNVMDGSNDVTDENGHGTFVSGVLAATRNNGIGIAGFCTDATIVPIKCFTQSNETSASYIISAIYEAVDVYHCDVINMSLGMEDDMRSMKTAVEYAASEGAIVVAAVGNKGTSELSYPAAYSCVIGVGSIDQNGGVTSFSEKNKSVFVVAPGTNIIGLKYSTNYSYKFDGAGTSYSAPFVSVAGVILKQYAPNATTADFKTILQASCIDAGASGYDTSYGYGKLNISNFIKTMKSSTVGDVGTVFPDVEGHWAEKYIEYCVNSRLFTGVTTSSFEPETIMNRAMFVTVLSRMSGETISGYQNDFFDVPSNEWYAQACSWGAANGIVSGTGEGMFSPMDSVTREQMAVLLYRYAVYYGLTDGSYNNSTLAAFSDAKDISAWAKSEMAWAVGNGLITGRTGSTICPKDSAARCEVATIIARFAEKFCS
ncbi:MAG: S8 family serine peptidase [Oscillospiraceae bacterium]|nr:S8 family serine peptidase [Oscillospiraceae bacterium]